MNKIFNRILVTSALPYANGKIHLGHLAGAYLPADIYVRYQRSMKRDVIFICGSDEHGVPITITADQEKTVPQIIVDRYHALNKAAFEKFGMSFDNYSRTSLPVHHEVAEEFFLKLHKAGILKEKKEKQLYDQEAGMFLPDRYVEGDCPVCGNPEAQGDQCEKCGTFLNPLELVNPRSKISKGIPTVKETTHLYFPLGEYQEKLELYIDESDKHDKWKDNVLQYCRGWFRDGLQDRAVTRDLNWGVRVPLRGFDNKVLYVWFDAVLGYISASKEWAERAGRPDRWKDYWLNSSTKYVAFIGKDNVVFHCIVFPAMLMAWNENSAEKYVLPANVPANEFLNFEGQKFSKSRGWGIDVDEFLDEYPADALRYTLTMNLPESRDADFYWKDFQARNNNELADILGNFVNRTLTFVRRNYGGMVPVPGPLQDIDRAILSEQRAVPGVAGELFEKYRFREGALRIMNLARMSNKYFNDCEPWKTLRNDPEKCGTTMYTCLELMRSLAILFEPIIPTASQKIWKMLGLPGIPRDAGWSSASDPALKYGERIGEPELLFNKIENESIDKHIGKLPEQSAVADVHQPVKSEITIEDFRKLDLRIGEVVQAEKILKADKLLKLQIVIGSERRQIIAGIARQYEPGTLVGKKVVLVANLAPAKLMGEVSKGMLLAASDDQGNLSLVVPEREIGEGSVVK